MPVELRRMSDENVPASPLLAVRGLAFSRDETPIFGLLGDRMSRKWLITLGVITFVLIGIFAFTAVWALVWFVLGYLMYSFVFATMGATVSRLEDLQSLTYVPSVLLLPPWTERALERRERPWPPGSGPGPCSARPRPRGTADRLWCPPSVPRRERRPR